MQNQRTKRQGENGSRDRSAPGLRPACEPLSGDCEIGGMKMPDREKVIKGLECCTKGNTCSSDCPYFKEVAMTDGRCITALQADALALLKEQEAKTGHWIEKEDYNLDTYYDCSVCGESWSMIDGTPWENGMNYCPHCGAKMEGR